MSDETDPAEKEKALQYWGYLFQRNKSPTVKLDRLLRGIAACISTRLEPSDTNDLTPNQLSAFYRTVGGDYDSLFLDMPSQSIAFIYKSLGCLHSLQPSPEDVDEDGSYYSAPSIPALKPRGFVTWQTIQLLLGPEEHVPFIQHALRAFPVHDPDDRKPFPKIIPDECFPTRPDPDMVGWHQGVSERLRLEAEHSDPPPGKLEARVHSPRSDSFESNEHAHAAQYFSDSLNRNREGRPHIVRRFERAPERVKQGGKVVASTMKQIASPYLWSGGGSTARSKSPKHAKSPTNHSDEHLAYQEDHVRSSSGSRTRHDRHRSRHGHSSARSPRREHPLASPGLDSASDDGSFTPETPSQRSQRIRRHRSHDPSPSPQGYFGNTAYPQSPPSHGRSHHQSPHEHRRRRSDEFRPPPKASAYVSPTDSVNSGAKASHMPSKSATGMDARYSAPYRQLPPSSARHPSYPFRHGEFSPGVHPPDATSPPDDYAWNGRGPQPLWPPPQPSSGPGAPQPSSARGAPRPGMPAPAPSHRYVSPQSVAANGVGGRRYPREAPWQP